METIGFTMQLLPGNAREYQARHEAIWPELVAALKAAGIHNYSIFLNNETHTLFAVLDQADPERMAQLAHLPIMRKWWDAMAPLMVTNPDNEPVTTPLQRVFHLA